LVVPPDGTTVFLFTLVFFTTFIAIGEFIRVLLNLVTRGKIGGNCSFFEVLSIDLALATATIPLLVMALTFLGNLLNAYSVVIFTTVAVSFCVYMSRDRIIHCLSMGMKTVKSSVSFSQSIINVKPLMVFTGIIFLASMFVRLYPTIGLYVYPADDAKMHTFLANLVVESNGYPWSFGRYAPTSSLSQVGIIYPLGFHAICAFFYFLTSVPIEVCVLLVTQIYSGLIAMSLLCFASRLFKNKFAGLLSSIFIGLVSSQPMFFFGWGGNAELVGDFILLMFLTLYFEKTFIEKFSTDILVTCTILFTGLLYIHELSAFYCICCILPFLVYHCIYHRSPKLAFYTGLILISATILNFSLMTRVVNLYFNTAKVEMLGGSMNEILREWRYLGPEYILYKDWPDRLWHILESWFGLQLVIFSCIGIMFVLIESYKKRDQLVVLIGWLVALLVVHENGPYGFFFIKIPLWYLLLPNRFFLAMSMPLSCLAGYCLSKFSAIAQRISSSLKTLRRKKAIFYQLLWIIPVSMLLVNQTCTNFATMIEYRDRAAVTNQDYQAFIWIRNHTKSDAAFYGIESAQWIPAIAQRRVLPTVINALVENDATKEYIDDMETLSHLMMIDPNKATALELLSKYRITHVFIGAKSIFGRPQLNATFFLNSTHYSLLYHEEGTQVYIFEIVYS